jgi:hypothetical protein
MENRLALYLWYATWRLRAAAKFKMNMAHHGSKPIETDLGRSLTRRIRLIAFLAFYFLCQWTSPPPFLQQCSGIKRKGWDCLQILYYTYSLYHT